MLSSEESDRFPPSLFTLVTIIACLSARITGFYLVLHVVNFRIYEAYIFRSTELCLDKVNLSMIMKRHILNLFCIALPVQT